MPCSAGPADGGADAARRDDVVFLDQDAVVEAEAVIGAAADAHGVLLREPQAGQRLAGVQDPGAGAGDGIRAGPGRRGHGGQRLQEIERGALPGEQRAGGAVQFAEHLVGLDAVAFGHPPLDA